MRKQWRKTNRTIGGHKAVENKLNMAGPGEPARHEICLAGYRGEIWIYSEVPLVYAAVITSPRVANALAPRFGRKPEYKKGDEMLIKFEEKDLPEVVSAIKMPKSHGTRVRLANSFGLKKS